MRNCTKILATILTLVCSSLLAVDLVAPTSPVKPSSLVTIQIRDLSDFDQSQSSVDWSPKIGVTVIPASWGGKSFLIFQASEPGDYAVTISVNAWAKRLTEVQESISDSPLTDELKSEFKIVSAKILESNRYSEATATITVEGAKPTPTPTPDPVPPVVVVPGKRLVVIIRETLDSTPALARTLIALRDGSIAKSWKAAGHSLYVLDKDLPSAKDWAALVSDLQLPAIVICDEKKTIIHKSTLPTSIEAIDQLVRGK